MSTMSWLSRLVIGKDTVAAKEAAQRTYNRAINGHKLEPEEMRAKLQSILKNVESKVSALSIPPPPATEVEDERRSEHESTDRAEEVGAC